MDQAKTKLSVTLAPDIIEEVDRAVERRVGASRSAVIEEWLRKASRLNAEAQLREDTIAHYESLSKADIVDEGALGAASSRAARRLAIDE